MHIVTRRHLNDAAKQYPDAEKEIGAWAAVIKEVRWHNFSEVRSMFMDADNVKGYVIFNIRQNRYRLITLIHYAKTGKTRRTKGHVYIRSFLTHRNTTIRRIGIGDSGQNDDRSGRPGKDDRKRGSARHPQ